MSILYEENGILQAETTLATMRAEGVISETTATEGGS